VYSIIVVMLYISAAILIKCTLESNAKKFKYPQVICSKIAETYGDNMDLWMEEAANEFYINSQKLEEKTNYNGVMECLCKDIQEKEGKNAAMEKIFDVRVVKKNN
jgi:uncharacterized membrane protein YcgQ (UPF0703/DUF1980 family)